MEGVPVRADCWVNEGQTLRFAFPEERSFYAPKSMELVPMYEDEDYLIVDKGRGITCMPTGSVCIFNGLKGLYPNEKFHVITRLEKIRRGWCFWRNLPWRRVKCTPLRSKRSIRRWQRGK